MYNSCIVSNKGQEIAQLQKSNKAVVQKFKLVYNSCIV